MRSNSLLRYGSLGVVVVAAACGTAGGQDVQRADETVAVRIAQVGDSILARPVIATGVLAPKEEVQLAFKVGGVVADVRVHEGDVVRAGQLLATLDTREIDARVRQAQSAAEKAGRDLQRARNLYRDSVATLEQLQNAGTAADVAQADLTAARFNRRFATIVAPADGTVLKRTAEPGELVSPGFSLLTVASAGRGNVIRVALADRDVVRLRRGDEAAVRFDAVPGGALPGRVTQIAAAADARTGTYAVEVALQDGGRGLPAGLIGRVQLHPSSAERLSLVPVEAIAEADGDRGDVYVLGADGHSVRRVPVDIAFIEGRRVAVRAGLPGAARVVTDGVAYVSDGSTVRVVP